MFLTEKPWVKLFECQAEVFGWHISFGNYQFNPVTDRTTCHRSLFQAYKFAMRFRTSRCDRIRIVYVTSPTTLASKGRHCHWDCHSLWTAMLAMLRVHYQLDCITPLETQFSFLCKLSSAVDTL